MMAAAVVLERERGTEGETRAQGGATMPGLEERVEGGGGRWREERQQHSTDQTRYTVRRTSTQGQGGTGDPRGGGRSLPVSSCRG